MKGLTVTVLLIFTIFSGHSQGGAGQGDAPVFTNEDLEKYSTKTMTERGTEPQKDLSEEEKEANAGTIVKANNGAVVAVAAYDREGKLSSHGSGFIIRPDGAVVTSFHVVENAAKVNIKSGGRVFSARGFLYADRENDVAVLKVEGRDFPVVALGNSGRTGNGEKVYVMSNPHAQGNIVSEGILSGTREFGNRKLLQITAPLSEGSSGGPVFDKTSRVIGMATFLLRVPGRLDTGGILNFAVPVDFIRDAASAEHVTEFGETSAGDRTRTVEYWLNYGNALNSTGRYAEAAEAYKRAVAIDQEVAAVLNGLGVASMNLKKYGEAIDAFKQALRIEPDSAWVYSNLGLAYLESGVDKEAIHALKEAVRIMPDLEAAHFNLGLAYRRLGMYREAAESYSNAVKLNPRNAEAHFHLGIMYMNLRDEDAAMRQYEILRELDPSRAEQLSNLLKR